MIPNRSYLISQMPPAIGVNYIEKQQAENPDIIRAIEKNYPEAVRIAEPIAIDFKGSNYQDTARKIWKFLRTGVKYEVDPVQKQKIRLPNRFLSDGKGDCKSFALFTASILASLGMFVAFRFVSYNPFNTTPTHVYVVTKDEAGRSIIIDGVWPEFNSEKPYSYKRDIIMTVLTLAGVGDASDYLSQLRQYRDSLVNRLSDSTLTIAQRARLEENIERIHELVSAIAEGADPRYLNHVAGIGKVSAKSLYLAPGRNAFLALVDFNVRGLAHKLAYAIYKNRASTKAMWEKLGGDFSKLEGTVNRGKDKTPLLGEKNAAAYYIPTTADLQAEANAASSTGNAPVFSSLSEANEYRATHGIKGIGVDPTGGAATATLLAAAAPVIAAVAAFLTVIVPGGKDSDLDSLVGDASAAGGNTSAIPDGSYVADAESSSLFGLPPIVLYAGGGLLALKLLKII